MKSNKHFGATSFTAVLCFGFHVSLLCLSFSSCSSLGTHRYFTFTIGSLSRLSLFQPQPSQSQTTLASVHFSLELSAGRAKRLPEGEQRRCTNQCFLPQPIHEDKGLLFPTLCFSSLWLPPAPCLNLSPVLGYLTDCEKRDSLGSRGSSRSWLVRVEATN